MLTAILYALATPAAFIICEAVHDRTTRLMVAAFGPVDGAR